jgi:hypothetical protein
VEILASVERARRRKKWIKYYKSEIQGCQALFTIMKE